METLNPCNTGTLEVYVPSDSQPWNIQRVRHISRRLGYGMSVNQELDALDIQPQMYIDNWISRSINYSHTPAPEWGYWDRNDYNDYQEERFPKITEWRLQVIKDLLSTELKGKMVTFWHNHFVTRVEDYNAPSWMFQYYRLLQENTFGNFKDFVKEIGKSPAMLVFLDGRRNRKNNPNENYARELFELFTLGEDNGYTQQDIVEASRALTGYTNVRELGGTITFDESKFDSGEKTIFGVTANFDHDSLIDLIFQERADEVAKFIVTKIYHHFVSPASPDEFIIDELATVFKSADWELEPVYRKLFKSEHFFDDAAMAAMIKSPFDYTLAFINEIQTPLIDQELQVVGYFASILGQTYFDPIDVAGWQGDRDWINSSTITGRWSAAEYIMWMTWDRDKELLRNIALANSDSIDDVEQITRDVVNRFLPDTLFTQSDYELAATTFKGDVPQNYFDERQWNLNWSSVPYQMTLLLRHLFRMPEFQLK
ncbi:DUF1800 domain-containing protein [Nonlabens ponticola]|uniref:DUF1800 domain-containing protein n=1 Tax=Nonlabens ponticola TaxID=2496866 RepID=A0A3S9MV73_9FLAO|nr:DUF1800 domain-containing protein [Nonlabens ponticola]AZQ43030.1 DUF1800 domain-containing protein [Nonlabens ponticola]